MEKKFTFQGYTFDDEKQMVLAKKEAEAIEYLRAKTDFGNLEQLMTLYNRILDKGMMETVVGNNFLREIRKTLVGSGLFTEDQVRPVPMLPETKKRKRRNEEEKKSRERILLEHAQKQNVILKIVCAFLTVLVVGMFVITLTGKRSPLAVRYEEEIINKYASWAQDLTERENLLREYIHMLESMGIETPDMVRDAIVGEENTP